MKLDLEGFDKIEKKLESLSKKARNKLFRTSLKAGAILMRDKAKMLVPVDTGDLKKKIKVRSAKRKKGYVGISLVVPKSDKALSMEYGWNDKEEGKPFIKPTFNTSKYEALKKITEQTKQDFIEIL